MAEQAVLLYDFEGDTDAGELSVREGDTVTVLNKNVGDGWWEVQINDQIGLVPESYCDQYGENGDVVQGDMDGDAPLYQEMDNDERQNEWQDDWDNDPEDSFRQPEVTHNGQVDEGPEGTQRSLSPGQQSGSIAGRHGTVKKNINRFSPFVKSGTEAFILGSSSVKRDIRPHEKISIIKSEDDVPVWEPNPTPFEVRVLNPKKQSKFRGIKTFIAYEVVRSDTGQAVSRRYKHYDWLHDRLVNKFTFLSVPPLPDKQFYGRYGEEFVEKRREKLQMWTNRIARHPILSRSDVFHHFLTCPESDEREWKAGKRKAEKDEVCGANLYLCLEPQVVPEVSENERKVEHFGHFMVDMEENCLKLKAKLIDHCNKMSGPFMAEQHRMAAAIAGLGQSFRREDQPYSNPLSEAINFTAETYREIGEMYSGQPKYDMIPTMDGLKEYLGLIQEFPGTVDMHRGLVGKIRDCEKMKEEGRIDFMEANDMTSRAEKVSTVVMAEINHFQRERVKDFRSIMKFMLEEQIKFYTNITDKLKASLARYDDDTYL